MRDSILVAVTEYPEMKKPGKKSSDFYRASIFEGLL
jgi:hypothetical protein